MALLFAFIFQFGSCLMLGLTLHRLSASHAKASEPGLLTTKVIWPFFIIFCMYLAILLFSCYDWEDFSLYRIVVDVIFYETILVIEVIEVYILMSFELTDYKMVPVVL